MPLSIATRRAPLSIAPLYLYAHQFLSVVGMFLFTSVSYVVACHRGRWLSLEAPSLGGPLTQRASLELCLLCLDVDAERREH